MCQLRSQVYPDERGKVRGRERTVPSFSSHGRDGMSPSPSHLDSVTSVSQVFKSDSRHWSHPSETWATVKSQIVGSCGCLTSLLNRLISAGVSFHPCFSFISNYHVQLCFIEVLFPVPKQRLQKFSQFSYDLIFRIQLNFKLKASLPS